MTCTNNLKTVLFIIPFVILVFGFAFFSEDKIQNKITGMGGGGSPNTEPPPKKVELEITDFIYNLSHAQTALTQSQNLRSVFTGEDWFDEWSKSVDEWYRKTFVGETLGFLTTDELIHKLCSHWPGNEEPQEGIFIETPGGRTYIVANVQGERITINQPDEITNEIRPVYIYAFTYLINAEPQELRFNIQLRGEKNPYLYTNWIEVKKGEKKSVGGQSTIIKNSTIYYNGICIKFEEKQKMAGNEYKDELCNSISESDKSPTDYFVPGQITPQQPELNTDW